MFANQENSNVTHNVAVSSEEENVKKMDNNVFDILNVTEHSKENEKEEKKEEENKEKTKENETNSNEDDKNDEKKEDKKEEKEEDKKEEKEEKSKGGWTKGMENLFLWWN